MLSKCCDCGRTAERLLKVEIGKVNGRPVTSRLCRECYGLRRAALVLIPPPGRPDDESPELRVA